MQPRRCRTVSWWRRIKTSAVCHASSRRDSRGHVATRVMRRNANRRHMTGDRDGQAAGRQPCWSEPWTGLRGTVRSWPLLVLAAPAAAEVWSGWVGIAEKTGFGRVSPLPGIWPSLHLDTTITLPVGVEAYAAHALRAWLASEHAVPRGRAGSRSGPRSARSHSEWPGRSPLTCWPTPGRHARRGPSPPSCPACRSWSWAWGPPWPICSAPMPPPRTGPGPPTIHRTAGPADRPVPRPRDAPPRTRPQAIRHLSCLGTAPRGHRAGTAGTLLARSRHP